jgi:signal transduction histidine kinase/DNA-binding response OmpR family regulator
VEIARRGDGYLWLLASGFLVRFDGVRFHTYRPSTTPGLPDARLGALAIADADTVVAGTDDGRIVRVHAGGAEQIGRIEGPVWGLEVDDAGVIWAQSWQQVWRVSGGLSEPVAEIDRWDVSADWGSLRPQILATDEGIWARHLGPGEGPGLDRYDTVSAAVRLDVDGTETGRWRVGQPVLMTEGRNLLTDVGPDSVIELASPGGAVRYRIPRVRQRIPRLVDRSGRLWSTLRTRVEVFLPGDRVPAWSVDLGPGSGVGQMLEDVEGSIWVTTATEGLVRIQEVPFTTLGLDAGLKIRQMRALMAEAAGTVLAADRDGHAYRLVGNAAEELIPPGIDPTAWVGHVQAIAEDGRGTVWMAWYQNPPPSYLDGVTDTGSLVAMELHAPAIQIAPDPWDAEVLWVGLNPSASVATGGPDGAGLLQVRPYEAGGPRVQAYLPGFAARRIRSDGRGGMWATDTRRLVHVSSAGEVREVDAGPTLPDAQLRGLHVDPQGTLWVGTYGEGLYRLRNGRLEGVTAADGLAEDVVSTIVEDDVGNLWIGGNESVHRVRRADVQAFLDGARPSVDGIAYGRRHGLDNPEGSGGHATRDAAGNLWFPTFGGAAQVDPAIALALDSLPPRVMVEEARWGNAGRASGPEVVLERGQRELEITFTATSLRDPAALLLEYRLEGSDEGWVRAGVDRAVRYTNVPAGQHVFQVRARNGGGVWSTAPATMVVVVPPLFYETAWFFALLAAASAAAVVGLVRVRVRQIQTRALALEAQVAERTRELEIEKGSTAEALEVVREQAQQLRSLDRAKSRFFTNVTHELRTPLTLILGPLHDIASGKRGPVPDSVEREVNLVGRNARRLYELVDQLLDIARLEADTMPLRPTRGELRSFLARVAGGFESTARSAKLELEVELPETPEEGAFDPDCLEKILVNLLSNAIKYTPPGGRVSLRARVEEQDGRGSTEAESESAPRSASGRELIVVVRDTGEGIDPEELEHVFERFYRTDERHASGTIGSGVGLSLVRELVELHDGRVTAESELGQGSTFTVRVPIGPEHGAITPEPDADPTPETALASPGAPDDTLAPGSEQELPLALLVEDHPELRRWVRDHLEGRFRVAEAGDGLDGLALARELVPDVVVSDIMMPGMDGEDLCSAIKADPELDFVPVILLTARSTRADRLSGLRHGADAYLSKPFDIEELLLTIENVTATRRHLRERLDAGALLPEVAPPWEDGRVDAPGRRFLDHFYRKLAEHASDEDLSVESLAEVMGMSRSTLYRRIEEYVGQPAMEIVWSFRLEQAASWLCETYADVAEVAYGVGFKSVSHFSRRFRDRFGQTPSQYRAEHRGG